MKKILIKIIEIYQKTLSPDHGLPKKLGLTQGACMFYPTCSDYAKEAIDRHGTRRGSWLALKRIVRCHPFRSPSVDPVPEK